MANIESAAGNHRQRGVRPMKKHASRIDMTPMVDLGFLLITFFVMTARMSEPSSMPLYMPKDNAGRPMPVGESKTLTVLVDGPRIFYYTGEWNAALAANRVTGTSLAGSTGLREVIRTKQRELDQLFHAAPGKQRSTGGRNGLVYLIKAGPQADYQTIIDLIDETLINDIKVHMLLPMDAEELRFLQKQGQDLR